MTFAVSASFPWLDSSLNWHLINQTTVITNKESGNFMSTEIIVVIVVAVIVVGVLVFGVLGVLRRRRFQQCFGPEYDRLVDERDSRRAALASWRLTRS
jgi:heme/copper-type cytochrome/quinol oxidase subunit 2